MRAKHACYKSIVTEFYNSGSIASAGNHFFQTNESMMSGPLGLSQLKVIAFIMAEPINARETLGCSLPQQPGLSFPAKRQTSAPRKN